MFCWEHLQQGEAFDICKKHVDAAIARVKDTDENVVAKLVRACGNKSPIPMIMGADALQVGCLTRLYVNI